MSFNDISYSELWQPFEQTRLCNSDRRHPEEQFWEVILNLDQWFRRCRLKIFLIESSGGSSVQRNGTICNFGRGHHEEQFCDIILSFDQWFIRFLIWSSGDTHVQRRRTIKTFM